VSSLVLAGGVISSAKKLVDVLHIFKALKWDNEVAIKKLSIVPEVLVPLPSSGSTISVLEIFYRILTLTVVVKIMICP